MLWLTTVLMMYPNVRRTTGGCRLHPPPHPWCYSIFPRNWFTNTGYLDPLDGKCLSIRPRPIVQRHTTMLLKHHKNLFCVGYSPIITNFIHVSWWIPACHPSIHLSGVFHHRSQCLIPGVHVSPAPCAAMWQDGRVSHGPTASAWSGQSVTAACSLAAWYLAQYQLNQRKCENHIVLEILCSVQCDTDTDILAPSYTVTRNTYTIMLHQLINLW